MTTERRPLWLLLPASSAAVGGGHVSRCRALARAMKQHGMEPVFCLSAEGEHWLAELRRDGFDAQLISGAGVAEAPAALLRRTAGVVFDKYGLAAATVAGWRQRGKAVALFVDDDVAPPPADVVIAPGHPAGPDDRILSGLRHAIIDPAYAGLARTAAPDRVQNVLVSFGRRDSKNATGLVLEALELVRSAAFSPTVTVVMGSSAPHRDGVQAQLAAMTLPTTLVIDADGLHALLAGTELAIGAGGVSLLERTAAGVPSLTVLTAENQRRSASLVADRSATVLVGAIDAGLSAHTIGAAIDDLARDSAGRQRMSEHARAAVDGQGAERVADRLAAVTEEVA